MTNQEDFAVVIGISRYPQLRNLTAAVDDAKEVASWLTDSAGGALPSENVQLLISDEGRTPGEGAERPNRDEVDHAFEKLLKFSGRDDERIGRRLYIYMTGHGYAINPDDVALVMADASPDSLGRAVAAKTYADFFTQSVKFDEVVLFVDCDRTTPLDASPPSPSSPPWVTRVPSPRSRREASFFYAYATARGNHAYETVTEGAERARGLFTTAILQGLRGSAAGPDGTVSSQTLHAYLSRPLGQAGALEQLPSVILGGPSPIIFVNISQHGEPRGAATTEIPRPETSERKPVLAGYQSDDPTGADLLDITPEVSALASVLAAKDVDPPLSLGLFGDWGTGKSFFMHKLEREIDRLQRDAKKAEGESAKSAYCSSIVQITFNAWNYIDSNLWASLTSEIFENLAAAIAKERRADSPDSGKSEDPEVLAAQRELVLAAASSSEAILAAAERKKAEAERELKQTEEQLLLLQKSEANIEASFTVGEITKQAMRSAMQDEQMQKYVKKIAETVHFSEGKAAVSEIQSEILELKGAWSAILFTIRHERRLWVWFLFVGIALGAYWLVSSLIARYNVESIASRTVAVLVAVPTLLAPFVRISRQIWAEVKKAKESKQQLIEAKKRKQAAELEDRRNAVRKNVEATRSAVAEAHKKVAELNNQLAEMRADRRMADFIRQRSQSTDYTQHLGIISRVRADFSHLSTLLRKLKDEGEEEFDTEMKKREEKTDQERQKKKMQALFPRIDRIVLYIDDLDRCPEKTVVDVLQAVHLLLAFPLFVVVVGVDPRWLLYSLQQSSRAFQHKIKDGGIPDSVEEEGHWQSTPLNYLEKIFQIPFSLRPISKKGFGKLVETFAKAPAPAPQPHASHMPKPREPVKEQGFVLGSKPSPEPSPASSPLPPPPTLGPVPPAATPRVEPPAPMPPPIDRNPEHLQFRKWEQAFMKELSEFIPSPRAAKRFINIYRLLRASVEEGERAAFDGNQQGRGLSGTDAAPGHSHRLSCPGNGDSPYTDRGKSARKLGEICRFIQGTHPRKPSSPAEPETEAAVRTGRAGSSSFWSDYSSGHAVLV